MPDFYPFHAQIPFLEGTTVKEGKIDKLNDKNSYINLVHTAEAPLGISASSDPNYKDEIEQKAKEALDEIVQHSLWSSCTPEPAYILYQSNYRGITQTGIIGLCDAAQIGKHILPHEQTRQDRAATIADWLRTMNVQWNPVFLSYRHHQGLNALHSSITKKPCDYQYTLANHARVSLWCITQKSQCDAIRYTVAEIPYLYIADGHHRAAACQGLTNSTTPSNQLPKCPMLSVLMADRDLKIYPFYRRIRNDQGPVPFWEILDKLKSIFRLKPCSLEQMFYQYLPVRHFLLVHKDACWLLQPHHKLDNHHASGISTDVQWLQENVLGTICGITDPTTDSRIDFGSLNMTLDQFKSILNEAATEFILIPRAPSAEDVFTTADRGDFMPPKSTSFEPKIPSGLVVYKTS